MKRITKKEIYRTLRTYNTTKICKLYKQIHGGVPTLVRGGIGYSYKALDGGKVYEWASEYATSAKMDRALYANLSIASHHWRYSHYDEPYIYCEHGYYEPTQKMAIVNYLKEQCADPTSNYAKRPMLGYTHLYFCSPVYGHSDYNKWRALPIEGNERFCEIVIKYADKFFSPIYG